MPNNKSLTTICKEAKTGKPFAIMLDPPMYNEYIDYMLMARQNYKGSLASINRNLEIIHHGEGTKDDMVNKDHMYNLFDQLRLKSPKNIFTVVKCPTSYAGIRYITPRPYRTMLNSLSEWSHKIYSYVDPLTDDDLYERLACHDVYVGTDYFNRFMANIHFMNGDQLLFLNLADDYGRRFIDYTKWNDYVFRSLDRDLKLISENVPWTTERVRPKITEKKDKFKDHEYRDTKFTILSNLTKEANRVVDFISKNPNLLIDIEEVSIGGVIVRTKMVLEHANKETIANGIMSGMYNCGWDKSRNNFTTIYGDIKNNPAYALGYSLANAKEKPSILIKQWCDAFRAVDVHAAKWWQYET